MQKIALLFPLLLCAFPFNAIARMNDGPCCRPTPRWYGGISGGVTFLSSGDIDLNIPGLGSGTDAVKYKTGYDLAGSVGYRLYPNIRAELEMAYRMNEVSGANGVAFTPPPGEYSALKTIGLMANLYYDYHNSSQFTPYFGFGAGPVYAENPRYYVLAGQESKLNDWTLGYQFMTGIAYEFDAGGTPMALNLGYRYVGGQDIQVDLKGISGTAKYSIQSSNIELGAKMFF